MFSKFIVCQSSIAKRLSLWYKCFFKPFWMLAYSTNCIIVVSLVRREEEGNA
ncbi:hypothetical protein [Methanocella conradii]|uniref:hypothetical protein n=1 Tax=Methanocella conradii TaxID=1175444 RepID=UPI0024B3BAF1|nr:hypothetical protein [Methanocella conradii]